METLAYDLLENQTYSLWIPKIEGWITPTYILIFRDNVVNYKTSQFLFTKICQINTIHFTKKETDNTEKSKIVQHGEHSVNQVRYG